MADNITIMKFELDVDNANKNAELLRQSSDSLNESLKKNTKEIKELEKQNEQLNKEVKNGITTQDQAIKKQKENGERIKSLKKDNAELKDEIVDLNRQRRQEVNIAKAQKGSLNEISTQMSKNIRKRKDLNIETKEGRREFARLTKEINKQNATLLKAESAAGSFGRNVGNYPKILGSATRKIIAFAGGISALFTVIKNASKIVAEFEQQMDKLQAITKATDEEMVSLREDAIRLGSTTSKTASQVAELQIEFAKLGFTTKEILNLTEATINLSIAAGSDLARSAKIAGSTIRAFNLETQELTRVVDVMALSFSSSALDIEKFETAMAIVAPVANSANVTFEETVALLAQLVNAGVDASTAGTGLRNVFLEIAKQGLTLEEAFSKIQNASDKNAVSLDLFGKRGAVIGQILALTTDSADELTKSLNNAAGSAQEMANVMEDNVRGDINKAMSAWEGLILSIENGTGSISEFIREDIQAITSFLNILILANKTQAQIAAEVQKRSLGEQAREDVKEFETYVKKIEERTGKTQDLLKLSETFLKVDIERLLILKANNAEDTQQTKILETRIKAIKEFVNIRKTEIDLLVEQANKQKDLTDAQKKAIEERKKQLEDFNFKFKEFKEEEAESQKESDEKFLEENEKFLEEIGEMEEARVKAVLDANERIQRERENDVQKALDITKQGINSLFQLNQNGLLKQEQQINKSYDRRRKRLEDDFNKGLISSEEYNKQQIQLDRDREQELYRIELSKFKSDRAAALASIAIETAQNIVEAFPNPVLMTAAGLLGALQGAIVATQPEPQPPTFALGGDVKAGVIGGRLHKDGGTKFYDESGSLAFEAERGEGMFITKRGSATQEALSFINQKYGGNSFSEPGRYLQEGGSVVTNTGNFDNFSKNITNSLENALKNVIFAVSVEDIQNGISDRNNVINQGIII